MQKAGVYDLELFKQEWKAFFQNPFAYAGTIVIDMVNQWYSEIYPELGFLDEYYLDQQ